MARPTKLTKEFLEQAEAVLNEELSVIIMTDEELVQRINERLTEKFPKKTELCINIRTFERWKAKVIKFNSFEELQKDAKENSKDGSVDISEENFENFSQFCRLIKKALVTQKQSLFKKMLLDDKWQRYAWIIERKFESWNLKQVTENLNKFDNTAPPPVVVYLPSNDPKQNGQ